VVSNVEQTIIFQLIFNAAILYGYMIVIATLLIEIISVRVTYN